MTEEQASEKLILALRDMAQAVGATGKMTYTVQIDVKGDVISVLRPCLTYGWVNEELGPLFEAFTKAHDRRVAGCTPNCMYYGTGGAGHQCERCWRFTIEGMQE